MALRRQAHTNHAAFANGSPRTMSPRSTGSGSSSPVPPGSGLPSTPLRNRISVLQSPSSTPSISSSIPFDWDAARSHRPAPYGTPGQGTRGGRKGTGTPRKAFIRKQGIVERSAIYILRGKMLTRYQDHIHSLQDSFRDRNVSPQYTPSRAQDFCMAFRWWHAFLTSDGSNQSSK